MPDTITVTATPSNVSFHASLTAAQLAGVLTAISSIATIAGLPAGKSLADVINLNITKIPAGPNIGGANVNGAIPA